MRLAARVTTAAALRSAVRPVPGAAVAAGAVSVRVASLTAGGADAPDPPRARPGQAGAGHVARGTAARCHALTRRHLFAPLDATHCRVRQASRGATWNPCVRVSHVDDGPVPLSGATLALLARRATEESP
ncbi:MAG: hypothetical protein PVF43_01080 [Candidatus Eiseniibacteriota bacterium]|jgi:hypothetical protein